MLHGTYCRIVWTYACLITVEFARGNLNSISSLEANTTGVSRRAPVAIKPLDDGLLVINSGDLRARVAVWTILVSIDPPEFPNIHRDVANLNEYLDALTKRGALPERALKLWTHRLSALQYRLYKLRPWIKRKELIRKRPIRMRRKRALFDFGGEIISSVFGLVTTSQLAEYKSHIENARKDQEKIVTKVNDMVTVVNRTLIEMNVEATNILRMRRYLHEIHALINETRNDTSLLFNEINSIKAELCLERIMTSVENVVDSYNVAWRHYLTQRASLEMGHLTEYLLPRDKLMTILSHSSSMHMKTIDNVEWYYQHILVEPIWNGDSELIYRAEIPLISDTNYLLYFIKTWPVPVRNHTVELDINTEVAFNTKDGGMFYPHSCIGHNPTVCSTGPIYNSEKDQCARGIVTGRTQDRNVCNIVIRENINEGSKIFEINVNEFILISSSTEETLILRCDSLRESSIKILKGTHVIKIREDCSLTGKGWLIQGTHKSLKRISVLSKQVLDLLPIEIEKRLQKMENFQDMGNLDFDKMGPMIKMPMDPIVLAKTKPFGKRESDIIRKIDIIIFATLVIFGLTVLIIYLKFRCPKLNKGFRPNHLLKGNEMSKRNDTVEENVVELELTNKDNEASMSKSIPVLTQILTDAQGETKQNTGFDFAKYHISK